ncbi:MAG: LysM peptidoglycan-binding domain-containing protein [Sedimentisphaerales bacterium]|nr:LysM peptidoglycan-binding domain-containing protein [Sedimentisphaerales bacterium]
MATYYNETWHNASPKLRVQLAEKRYILAKNQLEEARAAMQNYDEQLAPSNSYRPMNATAPDIKFIDNFSKKMVVQDYLEAFKNYIIAKLEFERLSADSNKQELLEGPKRPSLSSGGPEQGVPRGPTGMTSRPPVPPKPQPPAVVVKPTKEDIRKALREAEQKLLKGEDETGAQSWLEAARAAAVEMLKRSKEWARKNPSEKALRGLVGDIASVQLLGGDEEEEKEGMDAAVECNGILKDKSEKTFRSTPTKENFKKLLDKKADHQALGGSEEDPLCGVKRLRPPGPHTVAPGDTLSGISKIFYGSEGYWDVIYLKNYGVIGNNPDFILPGVVLQIP